MSTDGVKRLIQQYKQPDSSGKEVYWSNEIKGIWNEITKPEPGDQVGADGAARTISPEEAAEFAALANERNSLLTGHMGTAARLGVEPFSVAATLDTSDASDQPTAAAP